MKDIGEIYELYCNDVYLFVRRISGSPEIAEDITSETFFKALKYLDSFRGDSSIRVWLCQIAKNSYYSYLKKNRDNVSLSTGELDYLLDSGERVEDRIIDKCDADEIAKIVHSLEEPYKEVFVLRVYGELSFAKIGALFNKTANWACVTYHRSRNKILEEMRKNGQ